MALSRVQATGKVSGNNVTAFAMTVASPPTVGNSLVVGLVTWELRNFATIACTDNRGNTYGLAQQSAGGAPCVAVYHCAVIATTGTPFTITVTFPAATDVVGVAVEVSGVGSGLTVDQAVTAGAASGTAPSTGATAALSASEVFVLGAMGTSSAQASITVAVVSPTWTQELEELSTALVAGEVDSRILTGVSGATTSASWTLASGGIWRTVLVAFKGSGGVAGGDLVQPFVWGPL